MYFSCTNYSKKITKTNIKENIFTVTDYFYGGKNNNLQIKWFTTGTESKMTKISYKFFKPTQLLVGFSNNWLRIST